MEINKNFKNGLIFSFCILACWAAPLSAVPPAPGFSAAGGQTCFVNKAAMAKRTAVLKGARAVGDPYAGPSTPTVLVIRVDFPDEPSSVSLAATQNFFDTMRDYYIENSYGLLTPTFTVTTGGGGANGAYRLTSNMSYYGDDCGGQVLCGANLQDLYSDALAAAASYSPAGFTHIMIHHAGNGQETCPSCTEQIWSMYLEAGGVGNARDFTLVPEAEANGYSALGVICHEYGHQLGLPDLYNIAASGGQTTLGAWDIMDFPYTGVPLGSAPSHFGAWSKNFLGWNTLTAQSDQGALSIPSAETTQDAFFKIPIAGASANEYFLLEYRNKMAAGAAFDKSIAMSGLVVWHIDDDINLGPLMAQNKVNSSDNGQGHRGVNVVEQDGVEPVASSLDYGRNDAFVDGHTFTSPQSNSYDGITSGITITNISGVTAAAASVTANLALIKATSQTSITRVVNYPNPAGAPGKYPVRTGAPADTVTTMSFQMTRPVQQAQMTLDIYNLSGDRVRSVPGSNISLKLGSGEPSADYKWVYEYDWNGKNDAGNDVASGVYIYRLKADDEVKTGKLMIVR